MRYIAETASDKIFLHENLKHDFFFYRENFPIYGSFATANKCACGSPE